MNSLLQIALGNAAVCGAITVMLLPLARRLRRPALTHALCVLILLKFLTPPLLDVSIIGYFRGAPTPRQKAADVEGAASDRVLTPLVDDETFDSPRGQTFVTAIAAPKSAPEPTHKLLTDIGNAAANDWPTWLLAAWIASTVALGAVTLGRIVGLKLAVRRATVPGRDITWDLELLAKRLGIRRIPRVRFIAGSPPPMLLALFCRAELVIPLDLWDRLNHRQRQTLLLHELAHLRRRDHWVRYLELLTTCIYWWHPAVWYARRTLHDAEEHCCDAWVVWAMPDSYQTYMTTLLDAVDFLSQPTRPRLAATRVLASGMGQFHNLQRRLTMIRERNVQRHLGGTGLAAVVLLSAVALPLGAKMAGADQPAAAQPSTVSNSGTEMAPLAQRPVAEVDEPRSVASEPLTIPAAADQQDLPLNQPAQSQDEVARLEAELAAARNIVQRLQRQLDLAKSKSKWQIARYPRARLGHISFTYEGAGTNGSVSAFDVDTKKFLWKLNVPLNAQSVIQCYDNETLLIRSADGYTRLVNAEDGHVITVWPPGAEAPAVENPFHVNPFHGSARPNAARPPAPDAPLEPALNDQDQEKRMERMEQSIRSLTEAVNRLAREQNRH